MAFLIPAIRQSVVITSGCQCYSPTPDVQSNLDPAVHRHASMKALLPPLAIDIKVLPKHSASSFGQERDTVLLRLIAIDKLTPTLVLGSSEKREVGASTSTICFDVDHESTDAMRCLGCKRPVVVMGVVARCGVSLCPESFDEGVHWPALEVEGSLLDALDSTVTFDHGLV